MVSNNHDLSSVQRLWILLRFWKREPGHRESAKPARRHAGVPLPINLDALEEAMNRRLRMIWVRHTTLLSLFAFIVVVGLVVLAVFLTTKATVMRIAVGPAGSRDVQFVEMLAERFGNDHASIRLQPIVKNSPVDVKDIHGKPEFDLAVARGNMSLSTDWPVVAILRQNVVALIVPAPGAREMPRNKKGKTVKLPKIEQVSDLAGRRVGIVAGSDGGTELLDVILKHYGVATDKVQAISVEPSVLKQAIRDNKIDAVLVAGPATGEAIAQAVSAVSHGKDGPTFIEIDQAEGIGKRVPPYDSTEIVAGTFGGVPPMPADNLTTLSYPIYLVARKTLSEDKIAAFAKLLYTSRQSLAYGLPGAVAIESPSTDKDAPVLVHPGAAAYLGDNQKTFFDRYGDQIFYGLLIFPVIGSALAGFASYFRADKNTQRIRQLHRLLQLVKRARSVQSVEELDQLQDEADHILGLTIQQAERGQLDESGLAVFTLAIEQARLALSEQRSMLVLRPENVPAHRVASHTPQRAATG